MGSCVSMALRRVKRRTIEMMQVLAPSVPILCCLLTLPPLAEHHRREGDLQEAEPKDGRHQNFLLPP